MPHTGIMPYPFSTADLKYGTIIKWTTDDSKVLAELHDFTVLLVQEVGITGMVVIADYAKLRQQTWKRYGGSDYGISMTFGMAADGSVDFPMPVNVLRYLKGFQ